MPGYVAPGSPPGCQCCGWKIRNPLVPPSSLFCTSPCPPTKSWPLRACGRAPQKPVPVKVIPNRCNAICRFGENGFKWWVKMGTMCSAWGGSTPGEVLDESPSFCIPRLLGHFPGFESTQEGRWGSSVFPWRPLSLHPGGAGIAWLWPRKPGTWRERTPPSLSLGMWGLSFSHTGTHSVTSVWPTRV